MRSDHYAALAFSIILLAMLGCSRQFTRERYNMIEPGVDDRYDVQRTIGKPEFDTDDEWYYEDEDEHYAARIFFDESGRVCGKEWLDVKHGTWEGKHPQADEPPEGEVREKRTNTRRVDDD